MDHRAFVTSLPRSALADLTLTCDAPGIVRLAGHAGAIAVLAEWIARGWPFWPLALVVQGIAICFVFTLQHETTHKTAFRTRWLNEWTGRISGLLIVQPFEWFRYFHLSHHRHTNVPGKDPELLAGAKPETWQDYLIHVSGLPYWRAMAAQTLHNALGRDPGDFVPARARRRVVREARLMLAVYVLVGAGLVWSPLLFWIWILPCLLGQPFLRLFLLAEHGRCAFVADMFANTRTILTNRLVRLLAWNMPYHTEHHTLPQVPFHRLPELHERMRGHHKVVACGYGEFTAGYASHLRWGRRRGNPPQTPSG